VFRTALKIVADRKSPMPGRLVTAAWPVAAGSVIDLWQTCDVPRMDLSEIMRRKSVKGYCEQRSQPGDANLAASPVGGQQDLPAGCYEEGTRSSPRVTGCLGRCAVSPLPIVGSVRALGR
jgi:hypothetical protein